MKKLYTTAKYKKRNTKRAKDRLKQQLWSKEKTKVKRRAIDGIPIIVRRERQAISQYENLPAGYIGLTMPLISVKLCQSERVDCEWGKKIAQISKVIECFLEKAGTFVSIESLLLA